MLHRGDGQVPQAHHEKPVDNLPWLAFRRTTVSGRPCDCVSLAGRALEVAPRKS
jgi:hypothetical protein